MGWRAFDGEVFDHYGQYQNHMENLLRSEMSYVNIGDDVYETIYVDDLRKFDDIIEWCKFHYNRKFLYYKQFANKFIGKRIYISYESADCYDDGTCVIYTSEEMFTMLTELCQEVDDAFKFVKEHYDAKN